MRSGGNEVPFGPPDASGSLAMGFLVAIRTNLRGLAFQVRYQEPGRVLTLKWGNPLVWRRSALRAADPARVQADSLE